MALPVGPASIPAPVLELLPPQPCYQHLPKSPSPPPTPTNRLPRPRFSAQVPPRCIPIHANVTTYDWEPLISASRFDVVMMDPPWQLATANPTRGVALGYSQLTDADIARVPVPRLQDDGFLFLWVINAKFQFCLDLLDLWGYTCVVAGVRLTSCLGVLGGPLLPHARSTMVATPWLAMLLERTESHNPA